MSRVQTHFERYKKLKRCPLVLHYRNIMLSNLSKKEPSGFLSIFFTNVILMDTFSRPHKPDQ